MSLKQSWIYFSNSLEKSWIALNFKCPDVYGACILCGLTVCLPSPLLPSSPLFSPQGSSPKCGRRRFVLVPSWMRCCIPGWLPSLSGRGTAPPGRSLPKIHTRAIGRPLPTLSGRRSSLDWNDAASSTTSPLQGSARMLRRHLSSVKGTMPASLPRVGRAVICNGKSVV